MKERLKGRVTSVLGMAIMSFPTKRFGGEALIVLQLVAGTCFAGKGVLR